MTTPFSIRPATEADLPAIAAIYDEARRFMEANGNPDQWTDGYPTADIIKNDLALERLYVCLQEAKIVGVFCYFEGTEPDYLEIFHGAWQKPGPYGVVHRLAVTAKQRGIASFCLNHAFARCGNLRIDTHRDNIPMQQTLARNGFAYCGIIHCGHGGERLAYQKS